ncbi:uncharacterized protein C6C3.02c-like isoform X1 [Ananas comosus]|uniref:Uncharacterized protein C6C3.02c-like isoform X1 n=2 Tax=Ananas comosus TaxID=4615 RepID=A0A199UNU3_ANACO|nr:uncharacterized protein C6C3.02c-like isoform X1 [Ananas comosus]OAY66295.1 hypothetical protein ACMD2_06360 [Ananas comosus]CAD1841801.1 unnamed protein product [Ananas comosus var. bracteatus]
MPRRSSGGRAAPRAAPRPSPVRNPPQPAKAAPPPAPPVQGGGSVLGGLGSAIADGMAFGTGSAIARRAVDAIVGPGVIQHETVASATPVAEASDASRSGSMGRDACSLHSKAFQDCINSDGSDISKCQFYLDMLNECRRGGSGEMLRV